MTGDKKLIAQIDALFHPRSVAVVGVPLGMKMGRLFLMALLEMNFPGPIYPVNPKATEIDGLKCYPSVAAIDGDVDLAIVLVPQAAALEVIEQCAAKGVKGAVLFTAGGRELGTEEGRELERSLVRTARAAGMRLLGPNCMGLYAPASGLSFFPGLSPTPGPTGVISHSGSLVNILGRVSQDLGITFSKVASLGNEGDLCAADLMTYLGRDRETDLIAAYLEDIKEGPRFLEAVREASLRKPVILWKVGLTAQGGRAAASHTGALAARRDVWNGVVRQTGVIPVTGFEEWVDTMMAFNLLPRRVGRRIAVVSGPGGLAVAAAEAVGENGFELAELTERTKNELADIVPPTGTSLKNPIDVGLTASFDAAIYVGAVRAAASDPNVDALVVLGVGLTPEANQEFRQGVIDAQRRSQKPFLMVNIPGHNPEFGREFRNAGLPFFESAERAMAAFRRVSEHHAWQAAQISENS